MLADFARCVARDGFVAFLLDVCFISCFWFGAGVIVLEILFTRDVVSCWRQMPMLTIKQPLEDPCISGGAQYTKLYHQYDYGE